MRRVSINEFDSKVKKNKQRKQDTAKVKVEASPGSNTKPLSPYPKYYFHQDQSVLKRQMTTSMLLLDPHDPINLLTKLWNQSGPLYYHQAQLMPSSKFSPDYVTTHKDTIPLFRITKITFHRITI